MNNDQLDFYHNQINQNQNSQANIVMKRDIRQVSFELDKNFLESSFNKFLYDNFERIRQIDQNNQSIAQLYNIFQIIAQEIVKLKNDLTQAFNAESNKINEVDENKNQQINKLYEVLNNENSKNFESIKSVSIALNEHNQKLSKELENQSKKLNESIINNKVDNDNIKNDFEILNSNLNLAQNKNNTNEKLIKNLAEICNNNNKKISELEAKLLNIENNYKNNNEIAEIKINLNEHGIKIGINSNNILNFENKLKKYKDEIDNQIKDMKDKIEEMNNITYKKFDEITNEISKMKNDITNKKFESIKLKDDKANSKILDYLKEQLNEFIENNNKKVDEIKSKHIKDIDNINNKLTEDLDKLNKECDNKINNNLNKLKNNFEKIEKDFQIQNNINLSHEKSIEDIKNKINDNKLIIQNMNNKNDNKNKIVIENKKIDKFEMEKDKPKIYRMSQWNNQISFKDITNEFEDNKTVEKIKIAFKKDEDEKDKIIYEVHNIQKDWDFKRHIKNMFKRLNKAREIKRINLNKLKHVYILKFTDNQIHFIKKEAILNFVKNNNYYVKIRNNFVFVNNKRRKYFNNRKWNNNNFNFRKNNYINNNGNNRNNNFRNNNSNGRNNKNNFNNNRSNNQMNKSSNRRNQMNNNRSNNNNRYNNNRRFNNSNRRNNFNNRKYYNNRNRFNKRNF